LSYSPEVDFSTAGHFTTYFGRLLMEKSLPADVCVLKVDVPCNATPETPWEITRLSRKIYYQPIPPQRDSWDQPGIPGYEVVGDPQQDRPDSDVYTVRVKGNVSVTPLSLDLTSRIDLKVLQEYLQKD
jgi:5'-nucleotidase